MMNTVTSVVLLDGLRQPGNAGAWEQFVARYEPMLLACARRSGLQEHDARDVTQEALMAFMEAYRAGRYDRDRGRLRAWLQGIVFNKIRQSLRKPKRREVQVADQTGATAFMNRVPDEQEMTGIFDQEWERGILNECLREVRRQVDEKTFQAFKLYTIDEWPPERVAEKLGIERNSVYVYKRRVLTRLREIQSTMSEIW